ncbi:MAG: hypothetical protein F4Z77_13235 [Dehalococcoidia bacterium]|nr:hypothetical protein [Dehalococcoidia bacterium]MYA54537.1 hypothetical protein [Dehalococcoidia bacterium]
MTTEERISRLEGAYEQVDQRLGDLTQAFNAWRAESNRQNEVLRSEMNSRFNILLVVGAGAWVTTVGLIVGLYLQS